MYYIIRDDNTLYQVPKYEKTDSSNIFPTTIRNLAYNVSFPYEYWIHAYYLEHFMDNLQRNQVKVDRYTFMKYMKTIENDVVFPLGLQLLTTKETNMIGSWIYPDLEFEYL